MIQCKDCEFCVITSDNRRTFKCDPFSNVKEPECLAKWQLIRLDMLVASYQGMLKMQQSMAPLQDKILKYMKRELEELDESDKWKVDEDQPDDKWKVDDNQPDEEQGDEEQDEDKNF